MSEKVVAPYGKLPTLSAACWHSFSLENSLMKLGPTIMITPYSYSAHFLVHFSGLNLVGNFIPSVLEFI